MTGAQIRTERLTLRPARPDDCEAMHAIFVQSQAMRYWSCPPHTDIWQTREWLGKMLAIAEGEGEDFVLEHAGAVIGKAGFFRFPEVGFILNPSMWGQGLAREALQAVIARGFSVHGLDYAHADVDPRNAASLGLLHRLGFRETGRAARTWNVGGEWCDSLYLRLDRPETV